MMITQFPDLSLYEKNSANSANAAAMMIYRQALQVPAEQLSEQQFLTGEQLFLHGNAVADSQ